MMLLLVALGLAADPTEERRFASTGGVWLPTAWRDAGFEVGASTGTGLRVRRCSDAETTTTGTAALEPGLEPGLDSGLDADPCAPIQGLVGGAGRLSWGGNGGTAAANISIDPGIGTSSYGLDVHAGISNLGYGVLGTGSGAGAIGDHGALGIWAGFFSGVQTGQLFLFGAALQAGGPKLALDASVALLARGLVNSPGLGRPAPTLNEVGLNVRVAPLHTVRLGTVLSMPGLDWTTRCATGLREDRRASPTPACPSDTLRALPPGELGLRVGAHTLGVVSLARAELTVGW